MVKVADPCKDENNNALKKDSVCLRPFPIKNGRDRQMGTFFREKRGKPMIDCMDWNGGGYEDDHVYVLIPLLLSPSSFLGGAHSKPIFPPM